MSRTTDEDGRRMRGLKRLAVGYARVSTPGQGANGISLDAQKAGIERFAEAQRYTLIEIFDDIASGVGAKSFHAREGLQAALDLVAREGAILIVYDWDRLSRHAGFEKQVRSVLPDRDVIICAKEGNAMSDASRAARFAHDQTVADEISRRTKEGMARKGAEGAVFGNPAILTDVQPLGAATWSNTSDDLVRRIADVLRELDDFFDLTCRQVVDILNERGIRTLHGNEWTVSRLRPKLKQARAILKDEDEAALRSHPNFGLV